MVKFKHDQQQGRRRRRPPPSHGLPLRLLLVAAALAASFPAAFAFWVRPAGPSKSPRRWHHPAAAAAAAAAAGPRSSGPSSSAFLLFAAEEPAGGNGGGGGPVAVTAEAEEEDVDLEMHEALERTMRTVGLDWGEEPEEAGDGHDRLVDTTPPPPLPDTTPPSPFAAYEAGIEPPASHTVYYGGRHARSFWRQGREAVQLVVPVPPSVGKAAVRFRMESKTRLFLAVGDEVVFDRELAQPVYRETSFWYFEQLEGGDDGDDQPLKAVVVELDKRLAYSNWPRLFPEDPDLSVAMQQRAAAKQEQE